MSAAPRSNRREFLQGKSAADALALAAWPDSQQESLPQPVSEGYLLELSRRAMACKFEFFLNAGQHAHDTQTALAALDLVDLLEDQLSVHREHSEISRLNRLAAGEPVVVEERLFALLQTAVQIHGETQGAYDITAASLSHVWGFTRRAGSIPTAQDLAAAHDRVGSAHLELNASANTVRFLKGGLTINLGSIGKGYALDRAAEIFAAVGIEDFLLHGGHSSVLARGAHGARGRDQGWLVGIRDPLHPDRRLGELCLRDRALATSGSGTQFFMHGGKRYGHILDPRSGWPAEGVLSVSVLAPTAAEADALATAFYVLGPEGAARYCQQHPQVAAVMLMPGARAGGLTTHVWGLADCDWRAIERP